MPQYAQYDSTVADLSPVLGWYDTDAISYPNLPASADLLEVSSDQWASRMPGPFAVQSGQLVAYSPPIPVIPLATQAQQALQAATMNCFQRFTMMGEAIPGEWIAYNQAVAAIIDGTSEATSLPVPSP